MVEEKRERLAVSVSAAVFITDEEGKLLLLKQAAESKGGKWGPPGGGMHPHENLIQTAKRETREEIGVEVDLIDLISINTADRGSEASGVGFSFRGKILSGEIKIRQEEIADCRYFTPDEIKVLMETNMLYKPEYNRYAVDDWLKGKTYSLDVIRELV